MAILPGLKKSLPSHVEKQDQQQQQQPMPQVGKVAAPALPEDVALFVAIATKATGSPPEWIEAVCAHLHVDPILLPPSMEPEEPLRHLFSIEEEYHSQVLRILILASLFPNPNEGQADAKTDSKSQQQTSIGYTPLNRRCIYCTLTVLGIPTSSVVIAQEEVVAKELFEMLKHSTDAQKEEIERARKKREEGFGGKYGRWVATGVGVVVGGVVVGVTGGLAAPAILALLPSLALLTPATAPILLGTLFGLTGGGLAGRRIRKRWAGVSDFEFVQLDDKRAAQIEIEKDKLPYEVRKRKSTPSLPLLDEKLGPKEILIEESAVDMKEKGDNGVYPYAVRKTRSTSPSQTSHENLSLNLKAHDDDQTAPQSETKPLELENKVRQINVKDSTEPSAISEVITNPADETQRSTPPLETSSIASSPTFSTLSTPPPSSTLLEPSSRDPASDQPPLSKEIEIPPSPPSLTAVICVPGLLIESVNEGLDSWEKVRKEGVLGVGRDVFVACVEREEWLGTGQNIHGWVTSKVIGYAKAEVIKRTFASAYFAAIAIPLAVYKGPAMLLDNVWQKGNDRAQKAGALLAEVLESGVQGERPVVLVGSSLGALVVFECLLKMKNKNLVDSAVLISLPTSPSVAEWNTVRGNVTRRMVNAYDPGDLVLGSVARLHEVIGGVGEGRVDGAMVAGLRCVDVKGVKSIDIGDLSGGHFGINRKLPEIMKRVDIDS